MGISRTLLENVNKLYGKKIAEKHENISTHASRFLTSHFKESDFSMIVSAHQINDVVHNYFVDIQRFKERRDMHVNETYISNGKVAAFTAKWIMRLRPITVEPLDLARATSRDVFFAKYINEIFAIEHAEHLLEVEVPEKLYKELAYEFRQKKLSETQLYMTFEQLTGFYATSR